MRAKIWTMGITLATIACIVVFIYWLRSTHTTKKTTEKPLLGIVPKADPVRIPAGSCVSVMGGDDDLASCIKHIPRANISSGTASAQKYLTACTTDDNEAWLIGHGYPGEISTGFFELLKAKNASAFQDVKASRLRLFGCWTGAEDAGKDLVDTLQFYTKKTVWAQNSALFCVQESVESDAELYKHNQSCDVEATPSHKAIKQSALLRSVDYEYVWLNDKGKKVRVPRDKVFLLNFASLTDAAPNARTVDVRDSDRKMLTEQFLKLVDFPDPFVVSEPARRVVPLAEPTFAVTLCIDHEPRKFTIYGGSLEDKEKPKHSGIYAGLLRDNDERATPATFYLMDIMVSRDFSEQLKRGYDESVRDNPPAMKKLSCDDF